MKVWVLLSDDPDGADYFEGVFASKERADAAEAERRKGLSSCHSLHSHEVVVDEHWGGWPERGW